VFGGKHLGDWDDDLTTGEDGLKSYKIWNYCMWLVAFLLQSQKWLADLKVSAHCRYSHEDIHFLLQSQKWLADLEVSAHCHYSCEDIQPITSTCFWQRRLEMWSSWHEDGSENLVRKFWEAFTMVVLWLALEDAKIEIFLWSQSTLACIIYEAVDEFKTMCSVWILPTFGPFGMTGFQGMKSTILKDGLAT
jgi:hypothetical protein